MKANAANILKWIEALESPDAPEQCFGTYYGTNGDCCAIGLGARNAGLHPVKFQHIFDMFPPLGYIPEQPLITNVAGWNDHSRLTFPQIATKIREWCAENDISLDVTP